MIFSAIKERMNKKVKEIKKLYQATIDGGEPEIFHKKCDNIANTLVLYKTEGNRRFGAFASECWDQSSNYKIDKNCFLFSIDKNKIYPPKDNNYYQIPCHSFDGPSFIYNGYYCIGIFEKSAIKNKTLRTNENAHPFHKELFDGGLNVLSEDGLFKGIYAKEYEVFQIIF